MQPLKAQVRNGRLPRTRHHVYYEIEASGDLMIHSIWGAPKKDGPKR